MEHKKGGRLALPRKGKRYDKGTIVSIVESIEAGKPHAEVYHSSKPQVYKQSQK
jgi:hypothetical protein